MLAITTAHLPEARPLIDALKLKADSPVAGKKVFSNDEMVLIVTGIGAEQMALGTTAILTSRQYAPAIGAVNFGICAARSDIPLGALLRAHSISERKSTREWYPDMLLSLPLHEASIETWDRAFSRENGDILSKDAVDMEAAGFFNAARKHLSPHAIFVLKVVSDHGSSFSEIRQQIPTLLQNAAPTALSALHDIHQWLESRRVFTRSETHAIEDLCSRMRFTESQRQKLLFLCRARRAHDQILPILEDFAAKDSSNREQRSVNFAEVANALAFSDI